MDAIGSVSPCLRLKLSGPGNRLLDAAQRPACGRFHATISSRKKRGAPMKSDLDPLLEEYGTLFNQVSSALFEKDLMRVAINPNRTT